MVYISVLIYIPNTKSVDIFRCILTLKGKNKIYYQEVDRQHFTSVEV